MLKSSHVACHCQKKSCRFARIPQSGEHWEESVRGSGSDCVSL